MDGIPLLQKRKWVVCLFCVSERKFSRRYELIEIYILVVVNRAIPILPLPTPMLQAVTTIVGLETETISLRNPAMSAYLWREGVAVGARISF